MLRKSILPALLVISFFAFGLGISRADEVTFLGTNSGTFNGGASSSLLGLTYTPVEFGGTTAFGFAPLSLGTFTLNQASALYVGNTFNLHVTFTVPTGISSATFSAFILGGVTDLGNGGIGINFTNSPQFFSYSNIGGFGSFQLYLGNVTAWPGLTSTLTGYISNANHTPTAGVTAVPESSTLLLLGIGLVGLARIRHSSTRKKSD